MSVDVKICGITDQAALAAAVNGGAAFVGFVFFPASPRAMEPEAVAELIEGLPEDVTTVGVFADPDDALLDHVLGNVRLGMIQLHGQETPERLEQVRLDFGLPVMKAIPVAQREDLALVADYRVAADRLLFDTKPPPGAKLPGGNAAAFDWGLVKGQPKRPPWGLAGGLTAETLPLAVRASGTTMVDVSSGVEDAPGRKNPRKIRAFLKAAEGL